MRISFSSFEKWNFLVEIFSICLNCSFYCHLILHLKLLLNFWDELIYSDLFQTCFFIFIILHLVLTIVLSCLSQVLIAFSNHLEMLNEILHLISKGLCYCFIEFTTDSWLLSYISVILLKNDTRHDRNITI